MCTVHGKILVKFLVVADTLCNGQDFENSLLQNFNKASFWTLQRKERLKLNHHGKLQCFSRWPK